MTNQLLTELEMANKEIERLNKSLEEQRHFYLGQLQQKENIIKEVRELINYYGITPEQNDDITCRSILKQLLEILDKESINEENK